MACCKWTLNSFTKEWALFFDFYHTDTKFAHPQYVSWYGASYYFIYNYTRTNFFYLIAFFLFQIQHGICIMELNITPMLFIYYVVKSKHFYATYIKYFHWFWVTNNFLCCWSISEEFFLHVVLNFLSTFGWFYEIYLLAGRLEWD